MRKIRRKKRITVFIIVIFILLIGCVLYGVNQHFLRERENTRIALKDEISKHYNDIVITNKDALIYDDEGNEIGVIAKDTFISLANFEIDYDTINFKIADFDNTYINYMDVDQASDIVNFDDRYKLYIPFNFNIKTKEKTMFYDDDDNLVYKFNESFDLPVIIKENNRYGVEFNKRLLYIDKDDVVDTYEYENSTNNNASAIPVLNYHFVYRDDDNTCDESICISETNFRKHLDYIRDNNYLTITARELEMYIDGIIQLPKSVLITFDDGPHFYDARRVLNEYKLKGTYFFVTKWLEGDLSDSESEYVELHSHTHNMHSGGKCPGGQGGGIKCLSEEFIQEDLKTSREKLNGSTYIAYPFYEYNNYSIEQLKKAGFTMAFGGYYENGYKYVKPGIDKFRLPRLVIYRNTSTDTIAKYLALK